MIKILRVSSYILIAILTSSLSYAQTAIFSADTTRFFSESRKDIYDKIMEAEWRINGQTLDYGSKPIKIKIDNILDTILYRQRNNSTVDTILCNINTTGNFKN